jgi:HEAT repeat protein
MRKGTFLLSVCLLLTPFSLWPDCQGAGRPAFKQSSVTMKPGDLEALLAKIAQYEYGASREALVDFSDYLNSQLSDRKRVSAIEKRLIQFLDSDATLAGKDFVCRHLAVIGSEVSIPVLSKLILKPLTCEMSRSVLEKIPGEKADRALREALAKVDEEHRVGVINSIGVRRDRKAVRLLIPLLDAPATVDPAAAALARIGDREALDALFSAKTTGDERIRAKVQEALMDWADECLAEGRNQAALLIYRDMVFMSEPDQIRIAGLQGIARAAGVGAIPTLFSALADGEMPVQAAALKLLMQFESPGVTKQLIKRYPALPERTKVRLIGGLADGNDRTATSFILGEAKKGPDSVRAAALQALARLGDASCISLLSATAADSSGIVQEAARGSLYRISGRDVDQAILAALPSAALPAKLELLRAVGERGIAAASPVLVQALGDPQPEVRGEALKGLGAVGTETDVPPLLAFLTSTQMDAEREQAARALVSACRRSGGKGLSQVIAGYSSAGKSQVREALVGVVGNVGSKEGLPLLTRALKDSDPTVRRAAILALGEWPNAEPVSDLLTAAREASLPAHHVLALRSYLKLVALPSERPDVDSVRLVSDALQNARDPELKKAALGVLPRFVCRQAIDLATAAAEDPAVKTEAEQAVKRLKESMGYR